MGSNPTPSTVPSVRIPKHKNAENQSRSSLSSESTKVHQTHPMRDIYNRKIKLQYWIKRANTELNEPDRSDVALLLNHLHYNDKSSLWIIRQITALLLMRKQLRKPFRNASDGLVARYF